MKTNKPKINKLVWPVVGVLLVLLLSGAYILKTKRHNQALPQKSVADQSQDFSGPTEAEKKQVEDNKAKDGGIVPTPSPNSGSSGKSVKLSRVDYDQTSQNAVIQSQLQGTGWQTCTLELTRGSQKVTKTADALYQPDFSTCLGFSVSRSELVAGNWTIHLSVTNSDGQTYSASDTTISVK